MKRYLLIILLFISISDCQASMISMEYFNWHFGRFAAVTFNRADLEPVSYGQSAMVTLEGCASISDMNANLLFYTNGDKVWNRFNNEMPNGNNLKGDYSSTQSALILKKPGSNSLFYIFTVGKGPYTPPTPQDFCYSIVDMNEDFGAGDVIVKNYKIHDEKVAEKLTAVRHSNNEDYWVIAHEMEGSNFVVVLLTKNGVESVNTQSIGSSYDTENGENGAVTLGQLKANVRGDKLAAVVFENFDMELFEFDRQTGQLSNFISVPIDNVSGYYGIEFSPSGQFVYVSNVYRRILQFDISEYDESSILQSRHVVYNNYNRVSQSFGSLQLGPNGKIYLATYGSSSLTAINKPDKKGAECELQFGAVILSYGTNMFGLPNFCVTEPYDKLILRAEDICEGEDLVAKAEVIPGIANYTFKWRGPNDFTSFLSEFKIEKAQTSQTGYYVVEVYENDLLRMKDSIYITVHPYPEVKIIGPETICPPERAVLRIDEIEPGVTYFWFNGSNHFDVEVTEPGRYFVVAVNQAGCADTAYFDIELSSDLDARIMGPRGLCRGDTITLTANKSKVLDFTDYYYLWSTGDTTRSIHVSEPGTYHLEIVRDGGCIGHDTVDVVFYPHPEIELSHSGVVKICSGSDLKIFVTNPSIDNNYTWSDGIIGSGRTITSPGIYKIYALNQYSCIDSAEVEVVFGQKPDVEFDIDNDLLLCRGDSVTIVAQFDQINNSIIWNDGSTELSRTFHKSGTYVCVVADGNGCNDTTTFEIRFYDIEKPEIIADKLYICSEIEPIVLTASSDYYSYRWSNGAQSKSTIVNGAGIYKLVTSNEIGCVDSAEIEIIYLPIEKPEIIASKYFVCDNDTLTLTVSGEYDSYLWSNGSTTQSTIVRGTGTYQIYVTNELGCIDSADISISDLVVDISFREAEYHSEMVCVGNKSYIHTTLSNKTEAESVINEIILGNNDNFRVSSPEIPFIIGAYESVDIVLEASSDLTGTYETSILAISNHPCYHETMSSAVQSFDLQNEIRLPQITAEAGQSLCIPIYGKIDCGASPYRTSATIEIHFNAEFFNPQYLASGLPFTKVIENGICKITIDYADLELFDTETLIDELCGVALIGNPETTDLVLKEVDWHNTFISSESENGTLTLEACVIELRPIQYFKPTTMQISPLPASDKLNVKIQSGSIGKFELILVGFDGSQEMIGTWENTQASSVDLLFDISKKSQGVYSLLLKAPWSIHYEQILIVR